MIVERQAAVVMLDTPEARRAGRREDGAAAVSAATDPLRSIDRWGPLALLFLVSMFNYIDRTILSILQVPIKTELGLSDSQIGLLTGMGFALFYTLFGLPLARLADTRKRKFVIAAALAIWSTMTAFTGLATGFLSLLLLRVGVAFGEAGSVPASHSMISDLFSRERRGNALSIWGMSLPIGTMVGFASAGWLTHSIGWREAFAVVGVAGLLLVPVLLLFLAEPRRGRHDDPAALTAGDVPWREAVGILWRSKAFRCISLGAALFAYVQYVMLTWNAPFYVRVHHLALKDVAFYLAMLNGIGGGLGLYLGGTLSDFAGRRSRHLAPLVPAIAAFLIVPFALAQYFVASWQASLAFAIVPAMAVLTYYAPAVALSHAVVPPRMRAFTSAMVVLIVNIIGQGLGPLVTGVLSDWLSTHAGTAEDSLRYAASTSVVVVAIGAGLMFWRASHYMATELRDRQEI